MRQGMLDHGLEPPLLGTDSGYFQVTFKGPGDDLNRLTVPSSRLMVTPAIEAEMNDRQRKILAHVLETGSVITGWCIDVLGVARDTAHRDLVGLTQLGLLTRKGAGRAAKYVLKDGAP
jgi:predicted HTH transcriptional regulator